MPSASTPSGVRGARSVKENPNYPPQPGARSTNESRRAVAAAAAALTGSPSSAATQPQSSETTPKRVAAAGNGSESSGKKSRNMSGEGGVAPWMKSVSKLEERVRVLEEEGKRQRQELSDLRDRIKEEEFERGRVEARLKEKEEEIKVLEARLEERSREGTASEGEVLRKEMKDMEDRIQTSFENAGGGDGGGTLMRGEESQMGRKKHRCLIFTDSNGMSATAETIKSHIPAAEKSEYDIKVVVAFTTGGAWNLVNSGKINVQGAIVVLDCMTNDARGTTTRRAVSPHELVSHVACLIERLRAAGAASTIVCEIKPMEIVDVSPYNVLLNEYLLTEGGSESSYGCRTQIRLDYLKRDGYHLLPQYESILDRTYACALMGVHVPCPTPFEEFTPFHVRRRWDAEWPSLGGNCWGAMRAPSSDYGWR